MFSSIRGFLNHHKRKFIVGSIVVGSLFVVSKYTQRKLQEWRQREVQELLSKSRRNQHFDDTERSCNQTIMSVAGCIRNALTKTLDSEKVISELRSGCSDKISAWNKLKVFSISRSAAIIYANTMIVATLRIQVTLMGAYMFKSLQKGHESGNLNEEAQHKYLTLCSNFVDDGIERLCHFIEEKVEEIAGSVSLTDKLNVRDLEQIYRAIMASILADESRDPVKNLVRYMFNPEFDHESSPMLRKIINETLDLMESEEIQTLMQSSIRSGFVLLIDRISEYFVEVPSKKNGLASAAPEKRHSLALNRFAKQNDSSLSDTFVDLNKITMPMAKIIPIINGQVPDAPTQNEIPTEWLQHLIVDEKFKLFGANIYEAFSF